MTLNTLTYTPTAAGIKTAIKQLLDELQMVSVAAAHFPETAQPVYPQLGFDDELTREILANFAKANGFSKNVVSIVWDNFTRWNQLCYNDSRPYYIGHLLRDGVVKSLGAAKCQAFLKAFVMLHGLQGKITDNDWGEPDLRISGKPRCTEWAVYDRLITPEIVKNYEKSIRDSSISYLVASTFEVLVNSSHSIPFERRLWVGQIAHPAFRSLTPDMRSYSYNGSQSLQPITGDSVWPYCESFLRFLGVKPDSTPERWTPIDMKAA